MSRRAASYHCEFCGMEVGRSDWRRYVDATDRKRRVYSCGGATCAEKLDAFLFEIEKSRRGLGLDRDRLF